LLAWCARRDAVDMLQKLASAVHIGRDFDHSPITKAKDEDTLQR